MSPAVAVKETMEDRIKEFRSDPQKMDVTTKFVNEVVEKAKDEALKRMKEKDKGKQKEGEREKVQDANLDGMLSRALKQAIPFLLSEERMGNENSFRRMNLMIRLSHSFIDSRLSFNPVSDGLEPKERKVALQSQRFLLQAILIPLLLQHGDRGIDSQMLLAAA